MSVDSKNVFGKMQYSHFEKKPAELVSYVGAAYVRKEGTVPAVHILQLARLVRLPLEYQLPGEKLKFVVSVGFDPVKPRRFKNIEAILVQACSKYLLGSSRGKVLRLAVSNRMH